MKCKKCGVDISKMAPNERGTHVRWCKHSSLKNAVLVPKPPVSFVGQAKKEILDEITKLEKRRVYLVALRSELEKYYEGCDAPLSKQAAS